MFAPLVYRLVAKIIVNAFADPTGPLPLMLRERKLLYSTAENRIREHLEKQQPQQQPQQQHPPQQQQEPKKQKKQHLQAS